HHIMQVRAKNIHHSMVDKNESTFPVFCEDEVRVDINDLPQEYTLLINCLRYLLALCDIPENSGHKLVTLGRPRSKRTFQRKLTPVFFLTDRIDYFSDDGRFPIRNKPRHLFELLSVKFFGHQDR